MRRLVFLACLAWPMAATAGEKLDHITQYDKSANGDVVIFYGDVRKTVTLKDIDPDDKEMPSATADESQIRYRATDTEKLILAEDGETLGWLVDYNSCAASYSCPWVLVLYRHGQVIQKIQGERFIWDWNFLKHGNEVALRMDFPHGPSQPTYALYDVKTGRLLKRIDAEAGKPIETLPSWTKGLHDG